MIYARGYGKGYAKHIGRLGALAVALGVGYGFADATAYADSTDTDNSSSASASHSRQARQAGPARTARPAAAQRRSVSNSGSNAPATAKPAASVKRADAVASASVDVPKASAAAPAPRGDAPAAGPLLWTALTTPRRDRLAAAGSGATAPTANVQALNPNLLTNPGAEFGDPSLSGFSAVSVPGWVASGTPTVIKYGTPRNFWPMGLSNPTPDLPKFFSFPQASTLPDGGTQFFGGGNVASATLTQKVDLTGAGAQIDQGGVTYNLGGEFGGFLIDPSGARLKVTFLDANGDVLGSSKRTKAAGIISRLFMTGFKERSVAGDIPVGTRSAQVELDLNDNNWRLLGFRARYNNAYADNLSFTISAMVPAAGDPTPAESIVGALDHVYMVYMENKGYDDIVGSRNAPFLNSLINAYGFADNYYGLTHPSLPNYYPILGGSDFGKTYNCKDACIDAPATLMENLDTAGLVWRSYAQGFVAGMNPLESSGEYAVDETAFPAFTYFANNPDPNYTTDHIVPLEQMAIDLESVDSAPNYAWFAADENSNGEGPIDFPWGMLKFALSQISPKHQYNVPALDEYLSETVPTIMESTAWTTNTVDDSNKSVIIVTFDEDNNNTSLGFGNEGNHIVTVVIPNQDAIDAGMRAGHFLATDQYNHYSLLRMIEDSLGLPTLTNNDVYAAPMNAFWTP